MGPKQLTQTSSPVYKALKALAQAVQDLSDHESLRVVTQYNPDLKRYGIQLSCLSCKRRWTEYYDEKEILELAPEGIPEWFKLRVVPAFLKAVADDCYSLKDSSSLAEWITEELRNGPKTYGYLLVESAKQRLSSPRNISRMLKKLGFVPAHIYLPEIEHDLAVLKDRVAGHWGVVPNPYLELCRLPEDHPLSPGKNREGGDRIQS